MNVINSGNKFQIYGESIKISTALPPNTYTINFNPMTGFSLSQRHDLVVTEDKIYGNSLQKIKKVMKSYSLVDRNFGVLLSGEKGTGKSLFVRLLAKKALELEMPVITVTASYPGVEDFIASIDQECVVIFDEFEKTFTISEDGNEQDALLSLFDGMDGGHKLFVVTCNDVNGINQYMLNRPGRFHYHITINSPTSAEVEEYMKDKLLPEYYGNIPDVINIAAVANMPYDYLRAIAFELNQGYSLKEAMSDLNITRIGSTKFRVIAFLSNGLVFSSYRTWIDLCNKEMMYATVSNYERAVPIESFRIGFIPSNAVAENGYFVCTKEIEQPDWADEDFRTDDPEIKEKYMREVYVTKLVFERLEDYEITRYLSD